MITIGKIPKKMHTIFRPVKKLPSENVYGNPFRRFRLKTAQLHRLVKKIQYLADVLR